MTQQDRQANEARLFLQAAAMAGFGAWECDLATQKLDWTDGVFDIFGLPRGVRIERAATADMYHAESRRQMEWLRQEAIRTAGSFTMEARIWTDKGESRWMRLKATALHEGGRPARLYGAKQDITQERCLLDRLRQRADTDTLTGLANRAVFETQCEAVARGQRPEVTALAMLDVDRFKAINDRHGHQAGDECLRQLASRLRRAFRDAALVARLAGDEFVVLLRAPPAGQDWSGAMARLLPILCRPVAWGGTGIELGVSVGLAPVRRLCPQSATRLFAEADAALYAAKAAGRATVRTHGDDEEAARVSRHG